MVPYSVINELLRKWAVNTPFIEDFTVNNILAAIGIDRSHYTHVLRYLLSKDGYELVAKKMLLCPNLHKGESFLLNEPVDKYETFQCHVCGEEYHFDEEHCMIVFSFTEEFRQQELAEKKNSKREHALC